MDRIYTNADSDIQLFKQYAESKGWWYKDRQDSSNMFTAANGTVSKCPDYIVTLEASDFDEYPYLDTLAYLNLEKKTLSNDGEMIEADYQLNSTSGYREEI